MQHYAVLGGLPLINYRLPKNRAAMRKTECSKSL